jgi:hypothetical protein
MLAATFTDIPPILGERKIACATIETRKMTKKMQPTKALFPCAAFSFAAM